jgi:hypothetical protein
VFSTRVFLWPRATVFAGLAVAFVLGSVTLTDRPTPSDR